MVKNLGGFRKPTVGKSKKKTARKYVVKKL